MDVIAGQRRYSSRVRARESDLITGAANNTAGSMMAHEISQEVIQLRRKGPLPHKDKLAMADAIRLVSPD